MYWIIIVFFSITKFSKNESVSLSENQVKLLKMLKKASCLKKKKITTLMK